jgi:hypothetical protein
MVNLSADYISIQNFKSKMIHEEIRRTDEKQKSEKPYEIITARTTMEDSTSGSCVLLLCTSCLST